MFLPYFFRAKYRLERFPLVTLLLILANAVIYLLTSEGLLHVREAVSDAYGLGLRNLGVVPLFAHMFLHGDPSHLIGNMLFLWLWDSALEGRLGPARYLALYLAAGAFGGLAHTFTFGLADPEGTGIGASAAIMGLAAAYLYVFPFTPIQVFLLWGHPLVPRINVIDMHARVLIGIMIGLDILQGVVTLGADGVGHAAHLGGALAGYLLVTAMKPERDEQEYADAQALADDLGGDVDALPLDDLGQLMLRRSDDPKVVSAFCRKTATEYGGSRIADCVAALNGHARLLAERAEPVPLAQMIVALPPQVGPVSAMLLMRLAGKLEPKNPGLATPLYRRVYEQAPDAPDAEGALMRLAGLAERTGDPRGAAGFYAEMLTRFPQGPQSLFARNALARLGYAVPAR